MTSFNLCPDVHLLQPDLIAAHTKAHFYDMKDLGLFIYDFMVIYVILRTFTVKPGFEAVYRQLGGYQRHFSYSKFTI